MIKDKILSALVLTTVTVLFSCTAGNLDGRLDEIDDRLSSLEASISKVNDNATAVNAMYRKNLLISEFKQKLDGGEMR